MKDVRVISPSDIRLYYFGTKDVLSQPYERESRTRKLKRAMVLSNCEHQPISIFMQLPTGETLETKSDRVDYAGDFVVLKGGYGIPVFAIVDVNL